MANTPMPRADRLLRLTQILRDGAVHRAQDLAATLGVSIRTIYRDMDTLQRSGISVEGARGSGYMVTAAVSLPPLNLTMGELEALHLGMAVVSEAADADLQRAARSLSAKIDAALPEDRATPPAGWGFAGYRFADAAAGFDHMPPLRAAIRARQKLRITYPDAGGQPVARIIRPLKLDYWGRVWTVTAWSEDRGDFRVFRVDRIGTVEVLAELFVDEPGKSLDDFLAAQPQSGR